MYVVYRKIVVSCKQEKASLRSRRLAFFAIHSVQLGDKSAFIVLGRSISVGWQTHLLFERFGEGEQVGVTHGMRYFS